MEERRTALVDTRRAILVELIEAFPEDWTVIRDAPEEFLRRMESVRHRFDPSFITRMVGAGGEATHLGGLDGWVDAWQDWVAGFDAFVTGVDDVIVAGDAIVVLVRQWGTPIGGTEAIENKASAVFRFRDEVIVEIALCIDRSESLRTVGIDPKTLGL